MKKRVFWTNKGYEPKPQAFGELSCGYLVVGGGIAGVMTAYFLRQGGAEDIVLIERETIGSGATGHSAGLLVAEPEGADIPDFLERYGQEKTKRWWDVQTDMIGIVADIIRSEKIRCDFEWNDVYYLADTPRTIDAVRRDVAARIATGQHVRGLDTEAIQKVVRGTPYTVGEEDFRGISVNPLAFVQGLADMLVRGGVRVYERSPLLEELPGSQARTDRATIRYRRLVRAVDTFGTDADVRRFLTTIAVTDPIPAADIRAVGLDRHPMILEKESRSYHYLKVLPDQRLLVGFGDRAVGKPATRFSPYMPHVQNISRYLERTFPALRAGIDCVWSGVYGVSTGMIPSFETTKQKTIMFGGGTQIVSIALARHAANRILGYSDPLDAIFDSRHS